MLTSQRIEQLSKRSGVKAIAVENFLGTLGGQTKSDAYSNLRMDAKLYKWNAATVRAIETGIMEHFAS